MALATVEDLATYMQQDFSAADTATADQMLAVAAGEIKTYTGQNLEAQTGVVDRFRGRYARILLLSQVPVTTLTSVSVEGDAFTDYDLNARAGIITRNDWGCWFSNELITVTYNAGFSPMDPALKGVCLSYAARLMTNPVGGVTAESLGTYSITYGANSSTDSILNDMERQVLDRFRAR